MGVFRVLLIGAPQVKHVGENLNWNTIFCCDHSTRTLSCSIVTTEQDYTNVEKLLNIKKKYCEGNEEAF